MTEQNHPGDSCIKMCNLHASKDGLVWIEIKGVLDGLRVENVGPESDSRTNKTEQHHPGRSCINMCNSNEFMERKTVLSCS